MAPFRRISRFVPMAFLLGAMAFGTAMTTLLPAQEPPAEVRGLDGNATTTEPTAIVTLDQTYVPTTSLWDLSLVAWDQWKPSIKKDLWKPSIKWDHWKPPVKWDHWKPPILDFGTSGSPKWYGRAEPLVLWRDASDKRPFATVGPSGPVALNTSDLRMEYDVGIRAVLGRLLGDWYRLEASYFGSYTWDDAQAVENLDANSQGGIGNLYSPLSNFGDPAGIVGLDFNEFVSIRTQSRLNNGELNLRRRVLSVPRWYEAWFLVGGRYLDVRERFGYLSMSSTPGPSLTSNELDIRAGNKMIGFQLGLLSQFVVSRRCWLDFDMKGGIFQNRVSLDRTYAITDMDGVTTRYGGTDRVDRTSFVGDLSLQFNYQFASSWTFTAGYNAVWLTGLALGAENFPADDAELVFGPTRVDHGAQVVYHGMNFGLVFTH